MGLAGRKEKQRIGTDPRNLTWAQDNSRFGQQYLAKFGWTPDSGSGLGANGDGRTSHIAVALKLNQLGIGNGPSSNGAGDPNAIAWKQNRDFENVLKKLNGTALNPLEGGMEDVKIEKALFNGFVRPKNAEDHLLGEKIEETEGVDDGKSEKQRRKEERRRKREAKALVSQACESSVIPTEGVASTSAPPMTRPKIAPHMAHRAKFRASKQLASLSSAALSEILGVSSSESPTPVITSVSATPIFASELPSSSSTPQNEPTEQAAKPPAIIDDQLTTSSTSVADYFAAKLKARRAHITNSTIEQPAIQPTITKPESTEIVEDRKRDKKRKRGNRNIDQNEEAEKAAITVAEISSDKKERKRRKKEDRSKDPESSKASKKKRLKE